MIYLDKRGDEYAQWLNAHNAPVPKATREMPRYFLERELAQHFLLDKEVHTGTSLGAKPLQISFAKITHARAPELPANDATPARRISVRTDYIADEAEKCVSLWRAVIERQAFDLLKMWGASKEDHRCAKLFFESQAPQWREARDGVCAMAMIEPDDIIRAHKAGRLKEIAADAIGRERWITRQLNAQSTAQQPDLLYSMGMR